MPWLKEAKVWNFGRISDSHVSGSKPYQMVLMGSPPKQNLQYLKGGTEILHQVLSHQFLSH